MKDVVIIGAGILGASTAYHLAKSGVPVTVIDRQDAGQATAAAAGIICPWISQRRNKAWYTLAKNGAAYYETLIEALHADGESDTGYQKVGAISLHTDAKKLAGMKERAIKRREDAPEIGEIRALTEEDIQNLFPYVDERFRAIHVAGAARVNGRALRDALMNGAKKYGATFIRGSATLKHTEQTVEGVEVNGEQLLADRVIVTAGAWASAFIKPLGIDLQIGGQKAQIAHLKIDEDTTHWPVVMPPNNQYLLTDDNGTIIVGATYEDDQSDLNVTVGGLHEILDKALDVAPKLKDATLLEVKVGFRPFTPNFMPVIGEVPGTNGLLLANGLGSSGLTVGPYLGSILAKIVTGEDLALDLTPYSIEQIIAT